MLKFKYQRGFTLIELLIVIAVLGVLTAIVVPNVAKFIGSGNVSAANTELSSVKIAAVAYVTEHSNLTADFTNTDIASYTSGTVKGTYIFDKDGTLYTSGAKAPTGYGSGMTWDSVTAQWKQ